MARYQIEAYPRSYDSVSEARAPIARYLAFYNGVRSHSSLGGRAPNEASFGPSHGDGRMIVAAPRAQRNPAGCHLNSAGRYPNKRSLCFHLP
ncbi:hypothetical protein MPLA_760046 [Mesorhizobium sp. ORS 3359]|nr:hypothetical protein MPLA_760046 [Mesorhizobium sp. ORS 3359]